MGTITYGDKVFINENPDVADINKVKDSDMNEIKTAVNDNDTRITGLKGTILWTNSSPTSNFAQQTITLSDNLSNYNCYEIIWKQGASENRYMSTGRIPIGCPTAWGFSKISRVTSTSNSMTNNQVLIGEGKKLVSDTETIDNSVCIPIYLIGYKTGAF